MKIAFLLRGFVSKKNNQILEKENTVINCVNINPTIISIKKHIIDCNKNHEFDLK